MSPSGVQTIIGSMPKQKTFLVTSIYNSGLAEFDNNIAFINLSTLEDFFDYNSDDRNLEIILKAATIIIKERIINITFLSTFNAENKDLFISDQV